MQDQTDKVKPSPDSSSRRILKSTGIVSAAVLVSRILGLVREKVIAYYFPSATGGDAFYAAFRIPNLLRDLFGEGALSKAFIATFTATEHEDGQPAAWQLSRAIFTLAALVLSAVTAIGMWLTPAIVDSMFLGEGFNVDLDPQQHFGFSSKRELTIYLARIMFPFLMLVSFAAIAMGILNSKNIFGMPALASAFFNIGSLVCAIAGYYIAPQYGYHPTSGLAVGVLVGGFLQFAVQLPSLYRAGFRLRPDFNFRSERVRQVGLLLAPAIIGVAAVQVNIFVNSIFASYGEGWLTWINRAFRLMHLPIGMIAVAISTVALPQLSRLVDRNDDAGFNTAFGDALRLMLFLTLPACAAMLALAEPICRLLFEGGAASMHDTVQTARALAAYGLGLIGYAGIKIATDAFYARKETKTPMRVSILSVAINIFLNWLFIEALVFNDHLYLALSTAASVTCNFVLLLYFLHRRNYIKMRRDIAETGILMFMLAVVAGVAMFWGASAIEDIMGRAGWMAAIIAVFLPLAGGSAAYFGAAHALKMPEAGRLLAMVQRRRTH